MSHITIKEESTDHEGQTIWSKTVMKNNRSMISVAFILNLLMTGNVFADELNANLQETGKTPVVHDQNGLFDLSDKMTAVLYEEIERKSQRTWNDLSDKMTAALDEEMESKLQQIAVHVEQIRSLENQARNMVTSRDIEGESVSDTPCQDLVSGVGSSPL